MKCNRNLSDLNSHLRHAAQVRSRVTPRNDGYYTVRLDLDDNEGNLFALELMVTEEQGKAISDRFQAVPERIFNDIVSVLLTTSTEKQES